MMKVKCNWCEWQGIESDIDSYDHNDQELCPQCMVSGYLMDIGLITDLEQEVVAQEAEA